MKDQKYLEKKDKTVFQEIGSHCLQVISTDFHFLVLNCTGQTHPWGGLNFHVLQNSHNNKGQKNKNTENIKDLCFVGWRKNQDAAKSQP